MIPGPDSANRQEFEAGIRKVCLDGTSLHVMETHTHTVLLPSSYDFLHRRARGSKEASAENGQCVN